MIAMKLEKPAKQRMFKPAALCAVIAAVLFCGCTDIAAEEVVPTPEPTPTIEITFTPVPTPSPSPTPVITPTPTPIVELSFEEEIALLEMADPNAIYFFYSFCAAQFTIDEQEKIMFVLIYYDDERNIHISDAFTREDVFILDSAYIFGIRGSDKKWNMATPACEGLKDTVINAFYLLDELEKRLTRLEIPVCSSDYSDYFNPPDPLALNGTYFRTYDLACAYIETIPKQHRITAAELKAKPAMEEATKVE